MADPEKPAPLERLEKRIAAAKEERERRLGGRKSSYSQGGLGLGLRIATEMVSALAVGVVMGLVLDSWLGTEPWLLIVFFILGAAAAFVNLVRVAQAAEAERKREATQARRDEGAEDGEE